jgi:HK97 family phage major capsid protein
MGNNLKTIRKTDDELVVGNYMVLFGGEDLTGEHFTEKTKFDSEYTKTGMLYVDWEHGLDWDKAAPQRDDVLGYVDWKTARVDETGLWAERVLSRRNDYMQFLETLIEEELVGSSSEAVGGKTVVTADGEIQVWPLKRDALTVTPAEPRMMTSNAIHALKALSEFQPHLKALLQDKVIVEDGATGEEGNQDEKSKALNGGTKIMTEQISMSVEEYEKMRQPDVPDVTVEIEEDPRVKELSDQVEGLVKLIQDSPKLKDAQYVAPDSEEDHAEVKTFGDFLVAVRLGNHKRLEKVYKTALAEETGAQGGYGVPVEFGEVLLEKAKDFNALRRAGVPTTVLNARSKEYPTLDIETAPSAGRTAYAGGVIGYWTEEAASITESEPRFTMIELVLHKLAAYALASNEVRDDFVESIDGIMARSFAKAIGAAEEYAFFRGDGVGKPKGIMESSALISAARSAASTVALADLAQMISDFTPDSYNSGNWFVSPTVLDQIIQLVSAPLSWMDNMRDAWMQSSLLGYPLYVVGCLPALNTAGDILLVDPNYYLVGDHKSGLSIGFSEHYRFANDQVAWRVTRRVDGQPLIDSSITMEDASTTVSPFVALAAG